MPVSLFILISCTFDYTFFLKNPIILMLLYFNIVGVIFYFLNLQDKYFVLTSVPQKVFV